VQQRREPIFPILLSRLTYPLKCLFACVPGLGPEQWCALRVFLGRPLPPPLRTRTSGLFEGFPVLWNRPTSLVCASSGVCPQTSRCGPRHHLPRAAKGSPGSVKCLRACAGSLTRGSRASRDIDAPGVASASPYGVGTAEGLFRGSMAAAPPPVNASTPLRKVEA